jgi:tRNA (cmo5U34)-methyltransferase
MTAPASPFADAQAVARYTAGPPRNVPGFEAMQRMTRVLLAERVPREARVLVLGAGGGLELRAFAEAEPSWSFVGVDPSAAMLDLAARTMGPLAPRATLHHGTIFDAPEGPFDAGSALLVLHFIAPEERRRTLAELRRRLRPGAPFVAAHLCAPRASPEERARWMARHAAFLVTSGIDPDQAERTSRAIDAQLPILSPEEDEALLREAGFSEVGLFYAAFAFRGWVATA